MGFCLLVARTVLLAKTAVTHVVIMELSSLLTEDVVTVVPQLLQMEQTLVL